MSKFEERYSWYRKKVDGIIGDGGYADKVNVFK